MPTQTKVIIKGENSISSDVKSAFAALNALNLFTVSEKQNSSILVILIIVPIFVFPSFLFFCCSFHIP